MRRRLSVIIVLLTAACTTLAGCSSGGTSNPPSSTKTASATTPTTPTASSTAQALDANKVVILTDNSSLPITPVANPADAQLIGVNGVLKLVGTATPQVVTTDDGVRQAAPDQKLVVAQFKVEGSWTDAGPGASDAEQGVNLAVVANGARVGIDRHVLADGEETIAASVPRTATDVQLEFDTDQLKQSVSLTTGKRMADGPAVLYRSDAKYSSGYTAVTADVNQDLKFPFKLTDRYGKVTFDGSYPTEVDITQADLTYARLDTIDNQWHYPSGPDKALLYLYAKVSGGNSWCTALDPKSFTLSLPDGTKVAPTRIDDRDLANGNVSDEHAFFGGDLLWEVPADFKGGTLTITPGTGHNMSGLISSSVLDYHNAAQTVQITLS